MIYDRIRTRFSEAERLVAAGQLEKALSILVEIAPIHHCYAVPPVDPKSLAELARQCLSHNGVRSPERATHVADILLQTGYPEEASRYIEQALQDDPGFAPALFQQALILNGHQRSVDALKLMAKRRREFLYIPDYLLTMGYILEDMELHDEAWPYYRAALDLDEENWKARFALARLDSYRGDHREAVHSLQEMRQLVPADALERIDVGYFLADSLIEQRRYMEAEQILEETIALDPKRPEGHAHLAELHFLVSREEDALVHIQRAQTCAPEPEGYRVREARFLKFMHRHPEALSTLGQVLERRPNDLEALELKAELHLIRHEFEAAYRALEHLQQLEPDPINWFLQARCLFQLKRVDEALPVINTYLKHRHDDSAAYLLRAKLNVATHFDALAFSDLEKADELTFEGLMLDDEDQYYLEPLIRDPNYREWFLTRTATEPWDDLTA